MAPIPSYDTNEGFKLTARQNLEDDVQWEFPNSESRSEDSHDSSDLNLYNPRDEDDELLNSIDNEMTAHGDLAPESFDHILYPLRSTAERVGREVEFFAEKLDGLYRLRSSGIEMKYESTLEAVEEYHKISRTTVDRLERKHSQKRKLSVRHHWRQKIRRLNSGLADRADSNVDDDESDDDELLEATTTTNAKDLERWMEEAHTWDLLRDMLAVQYSNTETPVNEQKDEELRALGRVHSLTSEDTIWKRFLIQDDMAREHDVVVRWLKRAAGDSGDDVELLIEQLQEGPDINHKLSINGSLHTKESLKQHKRLRSWAQPLDPSSPGITNSLLTGNKTEPLVTQLDPDAPTRESRTLEKQDLFNDRALWLVCWEMVRRGAPWNQIREFCGDQSEIWRSLSLCAGGPARPLDNDVEDDNTEDNEPDDIQISGVSSSVLWRRTCLALAQKGGLGVHERAVYGAFGGDMASLEAVSSTWDDLLFAYYNSLLVNQFDRYMQNYFPERVSPLINQRLGSLNSITDDATGASSATWLSRSLRDHEAAQAGAEGAMKIVQYSLISKQLKIFACRQGNYLAKKANEHQPSKIIPRAADIASKFSSSKLEMKNFIAPQDYDGLRVLVHALFAYQDLGLDIGKGREMIAFENNIVAYADFLRLSGKTNLLPLYASRLTKERAELTLARFLEDIRDAKGRTRFVNSIRKYGMDPQKIIVLQLDLVLSDLKFGRVRDQKRPITSFFDKPTSSDQTRGCQIKLEVINGDISDHDELLIRSLEWFLFIEGLSGETFAAGVLIYKKFLKSGHISAALKLSQRCSSRQISLQKTKELVGRAIDLATWSPKVDQSMELGYDEHPMLTKSQSRAKSHDGTTLPHETQTHLAVLKAQSRSYTELEELAKALQALGNWRVTVDDMPHSDDHRRYKLWKTRLQNAFDDVSAAVEPLLHGWLLNPADDVEALEFTDIRNTYIPDVIIIYSGVLHFAGYALSREMLLLSMDLSTIIAREESDLISTFLSSGKMADLVEALAQTSRAILRANEQKGRKGRKDGSPGGLDIWHVKP